jgi:hypothetical protein
MPESLLDQFTVLDALENFYRDDIRSIASRYRRVLKTKKPAEIERELRPKELMRVYKAWSEPLSAAEKEGGFLLPSLSPGELRIPISPSPKEIIRGAYEPLDYNTWTYSARNQWAPEVIRPAIKRALLYAHSVVLDCQIPEQVVGNFSVEAAADWLEIVAEFAPLIRKGIVLVTPIPNMTAMPLWQMQMKMGFSVGLPSSQHRSRIDDLWGDVLPVVTRNWAAMQAARFTQLKGRSALCFPPDEGWNLEERTLKELEKQIGRRNASATYPTTDSVLLNRIGNLSLPGLGEIRLRDIIKVREDDAFTEFRVALRSALSNSIDTSGSVDEQLFRESMVAEVKRLERATKRPAIAEITLPKIVNWSLAALAGWSIAGWYGAMAGVVGETAVEYGLSRPPASDRALFAHYVAMKK